MGSEGAWEPDWTIPPGEILLEALEERSMTQSELARRMGRPLKTINEIVRGKTAITAETAIQLERALGISARFWNGLESNYRGHVAQQAALEDLARDSEWVDRFPVKDLVKQELIRKCSSKAETLAELLQFFRVSSTSGLRNQWLKPMAAFRKSTAFASSPEALAAWIRWGEVIAEAREMEPFDSGQFRSVLKEIRKLTRREPFSAALARAVQLCASAGVALIVAPELTGTHVSGAARWMNSGQAIIQLSLRYKTTDHFWFSFFHEAGHLLKSTNHRDFIEDIDRSEKLDAEEERANRFARDILIDPTAYGIFVSGGDFSQESVRSFAKSLGLATGIVVGRLQHDGHISPSQLNALKQPVKWATPGRRKK